jgi:hypothetical protein
MLPYRVFIGGYVYTVDSIVCDVTLNPLNLEANPSNNAARLLRNRLQLLGRQLAGFRNVSLDDELRYGNNLLSYC